MQINPLRSGASAPERSARDEAVARTSGKDVRVPAPGQPGPASTPVPMRAGLRAIDADLNRNVAGAQQALNFLDEVGNQLQALKSALSGRLSDGNGTAPDAGIDARLHDFAALWQQRQAATGRSLDGQLALAPPGESRQGFRVRGLDRAAIANGGRETLHFAVGTRRDLDVVLDPQAPLRATMRRLDEALMPAGVRVAHDASGELRFHASEAAWPEIRDTFAVKGGGHRFPAGQFHRVALDAEPDAIRPQRWGADGPGGMRRALQEIVSAIELMRRARTVVVEALADARSRFDREGIVDSLWASAFVDDFGALATRADFSVYAAIAPALIAVSRHRVDSLLSVPQAAE